MTVAIESRHGSLLRLKLEERRKELMESLLSGTETYLRVVGQVQGIADALKLSEEADQELYGGKAE